MSRIRLRHPKLPSSLTGWIVLNDLGLPRFWATIWADILMSAIGDSTRGNHLAAIEKLYQSVAEQLNADRLDEIIAELDFEEMEAVLGGFLAALSNDSAIDGVDRDQTWHSALKFIGDVMDHLGNLPGSQFAEIKAKLLRLERLYRQISPTPERPPAPIRALPAIVVEDLYDIFRPDSPRNPFRTEAGRWRNYLIFLLLLHMGLRRGEALILPADAVKDDFDPATGETCYWINIIRNPYDDEEDPRSLPPGVKNIQSRRQLPLTEKLVRLIDTYAQNYRGRPSHSFLFNSQKDSPLAVQTVSDIFAAVTAQLSPRAVKALADRGKDGVSPHDLRHTSAVYRLARYVEQLGQLDLAVGKLRKFFGWSPTSEMPRRYAEAYFETSLGEVWQEDFDSFVDTLRGVFGKDD